MKTIKYFKYIAFSLLLGAGFTSCEDDDLGEAPRLFRPIASLENQNNNIIATWDNIKGAVTYELELLKAEGENENGDPIFNPYREAKAASSPYTFENVEWDEKYILKIKAVGSDIESKFYETDDLSVVFISKMKEIRTIDVAALVIWEVKGDPITLINIIPDNEGEAIEVKVSQQEFESGQKGIYGLTPETSYKLYAYSGDEQTGDTYQGRISFKTQASEDFDSKYGVGKYIDLREVSDSATILQSKEIKEKMDAIDGLALILKGGYEYKVNNSVKFKNSVTFVTGLSLEGNAVFIQSGGMQAESNAKVGYVTFEKINFISDKAYEKPISEYTAKGFDGRQVYNVNGTNSTIEEMTFKNCRIEGYRAIVRLQSDGEGVRNLTFDECTINGIGDQGAVTTNNKSGAIMENIIFKNSTLFNIVMLCDLRASEKVPSLNITDCTFCYAPIENTENANTPLLRFASNPVNTNIENTIFGPSMATTNSKGELLKTYNAGTAGSIMLNATEASVKVVNSYKTNFEWTAINEKTYPIEGLSSISSDEASLFVDPVKEEFNIKLNFEGAKTSGAVKWRMP